MFLTKVVAVACTGLKGVVEMVGPSAISNSMEHAIRVINNILREKASTVGNLALSRGFLLRQSSVKYGSYLSRVNS